MKEVSDLMAGVAGEHLVCADLILKGYNAFLSDQGLPYDVIADINGRLLKIQVKTTRSYKKHPQNKTHTPYYIFNIKRCGKGGGKQYLENDVDMFAIVALNSMQVGYVPVNRIKTTIMIRVDEFKGSYLNDKQDIERNKIFELKDSGASNTEIGKIMNKSLTSIGHIISRAESIKDVGVYFSELTLESALNEQ